MNKKRERDWQLMSQKHTFSSKIQRLSGVISHQFEPIFQKLNVYYCIMCMVASKHWFTYPFPKINNTPQDVLEFTILLAASVVNSSKT